MAQGELDALAREACKLTVSNERLFELLNQPELKRSIERWYNSVWRDMSVLHRLEEFGSYLREKLTFEGVPADGMPDSWVMKFFGFDLDLTTRYMVVVEEEWLPMGSRVD